MLRQNSGNRSKLEKEQNQLEGAGKAVSGRAWNETRGDGGHQVSEGCLIAAWKEVQRGRCLLPWKPQIPRGLEARRPQKRGFGNGQLMGEPWSPNRRCTPHQILSALRVNFTSLWLESFLNSLPVGPGGQSLSFDECLNDVLGSASLSLPEPCLSRPPWQSALPWALASAFSGQKDGLGGGGRWRFSSDFWPHCKNGASLFAHHFIHILTPLKISCFSSFSRALNFVQSVWLSSESPRVRSFVEIIFEPLFLH